MNEANTSLQISRQKVLSDFFDHYVTVTKGLEQKKLSQADVEKALDDAI